MTRYILTIAGKGTRWNNYLGVRKHMVPIKGEPNLLRTIRLIQENDPNAEIILGVNPKFPVPPELAISTYDGISYLKGTESDRYFASIPYWNKQGRTVLIWGDVFFTEDAIKTLCKPQSDWLRYGRPGQCKYSNRKFWGEEFALSFNSEHHELMINAMKRIEEISLRTGIQLFGTIYLAMLNIPEDEIIQESKSGRKNDHGNMITIDDFTDDFDFPEDFDEFKRAYINLPKVLIAVPSRGFTANDHFYDYYNMLEIIEGSIRTFARGQSPARNRNYMIKQGLEHNCTHILFLDDDTTFPSDLLKRLIAHNKDIVTGLYLMRSFPHQPIIFDFADEKGVCKWFDLPDKEPGLVEIVNCGLGSCLIKTDVFKRMSELDLDKDHHGIKEKWIRLGEAESDHWCDDISFFNRARKAGFKLFCDTTIHVGHFSSMIVSPTYMDGKWYITYNSNGERTVILPMPQLFEKKEELVAV